MRPTGIIMREENHTYDANARLPIIPETVKIRVNIFFQKGNR
jgi:hypothetical protein